ncbi:unnamed protein product [Medioppia subpectinata]|uniref:Uncharacterized protein n=1 Tax=Medioppia subpectinata TaxID=1979941 RepID=A0A7R9KJK6_9ACAR|nr:unnamed protein product [Medioppia subpectinata]CAG2103372.1 unnamed protein product [Medioppia subpectinata]
MFLKNKRSADMKALGEKVEKTFQKECIGKAGDISKFKKVDLTKLIEKSTDHKEWEKLECNFSWVNFSWLNTSFE